MNDHPSREVEVFNATALLPVAQRAGYLDEVCAGDAELRRRVETLLQAHDRAGAFLENPPDGVPPFSTARDALVAKAGANPVPTPGEKPGDYIGHYKLLQQVGEGGCGVVYMAGQEEPVRRQVAIKIIKLGMDTRQVIGRFEGERQALALMDHPNIAKVLDAGATETGRPFFVMELVRGIRITDYCDQNNVSTRERLDLFIKVCQAIQHAHQKGIIHRDIKPSNILVTVNDGVPVPKVIDFGIAKATQGRLADQTVFTAFEQFIGTPAYMSPEQSVLTSVDVDTRSDIYSLGVLLYELLTGRTPFGQSELLAGGLEAMRHIIRDEEPMVPSTRLSTMADADLATAARQRSSEPLKLVHLVRGDLDWVVMKCLEKDRARRYETANGLARDVERFLGNEPIVARPPSNLYRFQKMVQRNRLLFGAGVAVVASLVIGLGISTREFMEKSRAEHEQSRLREEAQLAQVSEAKARRQAEAQELAARKKAYASDMNLLQQALAADDLGRAQELLDRQRPRSGQKDLRGWEWRYFWQFCQSDAAFTLCQRSNAIVSVSFSADSSLLGVGTWLTEISVWDIATRSMVFRRQGQVGATSYVAFAPSGDLFVFTDGINGNSYLVLWDIRKQSETHRLRLNEGLRDLAFTRDGRLFTCEWNGSNSVAVWDVESGSNLVRLPARTPAYAMGTVFDVARDGTRFAYAMFGAANFVRVADAEGRRISTFKVADELTTAVAFSKDGQTLITGAGYSDGAVKLWDVSSGRSVGKLDGHRSWVSCLKVLPDGKTLASASADRTVRLWDLETSRPIRTLRGQGGELWTIDVSPDGRWLASGCKDGSVAFWDLHSSTNRPPVDRTLQPRGSWWGASYSPDGRWFCTMQQGRPALYDAKTLQPVSEPTFAISNILFFTFSADMRLLVTSDTTGRLNVLEMPGQRMITNINVHPGSLPGVQPVFLTGGTRLLTFGADHMYRLWDVATWTEIRSWEIDVDRGLRAVSPGAGLIAAANGNGWIQLIPVRDPKNRRQIKGQDRLIGVALSPDGKTLAAASENGTVELWDTETATRLALLHGVLLGYHSVTISPDGERVAAGSNGQEAIKIWDLHSHEEVATLSGQGSFYSNVEFSPDGNTISARNWNGVIHFWTAPSWEQIEAAERSRKDH